MRIRSSLCLLISAVFLAAVPAASAGLRGTVNAQHTLSAVERWSHSPVCVALRGRGAGTIPCYQRTSPPYCRTVQYDAALEAAFWAAFDEAENQNQAILIPARTIPE